MVRSITATCFFLGLLVGCGGDQGPATNDTQCVIDRCWPDAYACDLSKMDFFYDCRTDPTMTWTHDPDVTGTCADTRSCKVGNLCLVMGKAIGTCQSVGGP